MTAPLTSAEQAYHQTVPVPPQSRRWRVTDTNRFWVRCCDLTSELKFEEPAAAIDAALEHMRGCPEARRHG